MPTKKNIFVWTESWLTSELPLSVISERLCVLDGSRAGQMVHNVLTDQVHGNPSNNKVIRKVVPGPALLTCYPAPAV